MDGGEAGIVTDIHRKLEFRLCCCNLRGSLFPGKVHILSEIYVGHLVTKSGCSLEMWR